jgi:5-hydroxyisourate hydrolase-like protein (transthyretin family)
MRIHLYRLQPSDKAGFIKEFITNDDGRLPGPALKGDDFIVGTYGMLALLTSTFCKSMLFQYAL